MNIIKIENVKQITGFQNRLEIKSDYKYSSENSIMAILSDDDINNDNCLVKLRGYVINILLLPKRYKYTFNETKTGELIAIQLSKNCVISYY